MNQEEQVLNAYDKEDARILAYELFRWLASEKKLKTQIQSADSCREKVKRAMERIYNKSIINRVFKTVSEKARKVFTQKNYFFLDSESLQDIIKAT